MRFLTAIFTIAAALQVFANPPEVPEAEVATPHTGQATEIQQRFIDNEKSIFDTNFSIRSFDVEEAHVLAADRWVQAITTPNLSEEDFIALLWINGQQLTALQRQNKIYLRSKEAPKWASFVFDKALEKRLQAFCVGKENPKECTEQLKQKALKVTDIFWSQFKKEAEDDFKKNGLDKRRIGFHQMRGHMLEAFRNPQSDAWNAINEFVAALKDSNESAMKAAAEVIPKVVSSVRPQSGRTVDGEAILKEMRSHGIKNSINAAKKQVAKVLGIEKQVEEVPEEVKPWNYVDSKSQNYDLLRASSRYVDQSVQSLGCGYFNDSSLLNGQIISRLLRKGSMDVAQLTDRTNRAVENWCYSQFSTAKQILECKNTLAPHFAQLNKYYWQDVKKDLEQTVKSPSSQDVDNYFAKLKSSNAISNPDHPLGAIHIAISDALEKMKGDWGYKCLGVKDEALGSYRFLKASAEQKAIVDNLLEHLEKNPLKSPPGYCARSVKTGMDAAGLFKSYPDWGNAKILASKFEKENSNHEFLKEGYEFRKLDTLNPEEAPAYAIVVYGGSGNGHVEMKVPTSELAARGITSMLAYGQKKISVADRDFAYVSDYIDSAPRSSPKSRIARGDGSNNGRPVLGIYVIMRKS